MMERRYDAYRQIVVQPFFRDHFARLDRQIVLADALAAFNAGRRRCATWKRRSPPSSTASAPAAVHG
jgi:predicted YcjX-like family ATPase